MKKFDDIVHTFDQAVERKMTPFWAFMQKRFWIFSSTLLCVLLAMFLVKIWYQKGMVATSALRQDLLAIERILYKIDRDCNILSIRPTAAVIDFLTVKSFAGSMVGPLNLAYSAKWQGPYVERTPSFKGIAYEIVRAADGYFVVPGKGVKLPNGIVVGKDIVFDDKTVLKNELKSGGKLYYKNEAFGVLLNFKIGDWDSPLKKEESIQQVNDILKEINDALPYTKNEMPKTKDSEVSEALA